MNETLYKQIIDKFPFTPTPEQNAAIYRLAEFVCTHEHRCVFLLKGYAGTGKTLIISSLVRAMRASNRKFVLMAPTGRAAKVFSGTSGSTAYTIHKKIYRQKSILDSDVFTLDRNLHVNTLFLVDEASMISNQGLSGSTFGSGRLLNDLISYVYSGENCSMILIGDQAQLPPVGETDSPALIPATLEGYDLNVAGFSLEGVMRQSESSGILYNATLLREHLSDFSMDIAHTFKFKLQGFQDIVSITGGELIEHISNCYHQDGIEETMVLCRSNKRAIIYNNGIRNTILNREDELTRGDNVMIVKNNYYWTEHYFQDDDPDSYIDIPSFIANGDIAVIQRIRRQRSLYGFDFADATLTFPDYNDLELSVTLLLNTLHSESPSLTRDENTALFNNVMEDFAHIKSRKTRMTKLRESIYFNAFQIKYAYAITCHKSQGGQWKNIFIDQGYQPVESRDKEYYRWLYTALTRATERVFLVNWKE